MRAVTLPASQARIVLRSRPISQADLHWVDTEDRGPSRRTVWTGTGAVRSASPGLKAQPEMEIFNRRSNDPLAQRIIQVEPDIDFLGHRGLLRLEHPRRKALTWLGALSLKTS